MQKVKLLINLLFIICSCTPLIFLVQLRLTLGCSGYYTGPGARLWVSGHQVGWPGACSSHSDSSLRVEGTILALQGAVNSQ